MNSRNAVINFTKFRQMFQIIKEINDVILNTNHIFSTKIFIKNIAIISTLFSAKQIHLIFKLWNYILLSYYIFRQDFHDLFGNWNYVQLVSYLPLQSNTKINQKRKYNILYLSHNFQKKKLALFCTNYGIYCNNKSLESD